MILRKPFAILIKNFKRIHLILSVFAFYLVYKTNIILNFFHEYISSFTSVIGKDLTAELFGSLMYTSVLIILLGLIVIMGLMLFKHKPIKLYIFNILVYLFVTIVYFFVYSVIGKLEIGLVDVRTLKMVQDLLTTIFILQIVSLCTLAVRATGFNIKKFDFVKDLQELEIEDIDSEEFEVNVDLDSDKWKRKLNRFFRHAKYIYKENKLLLILLVFFVVGITSTIIYVNVGIYNKVYKKNEAFAATGLTMKLTDSYSTSVDMKGNKILEDEALVAIRINVKNNTTNEKKLETGRFVLEINNHNFYHMPEYAEKVSDLGITYKAQTLDSNFTEYMFIYKIPKAYLEEKMVLKYTDYTNKDIRMKIEPQNLDTEKEVIHANIKDTIDFSKSILSKTTLTINEYYVNRMMKVDYNYCIKEECYPSYEYLLPSYTGNKDKVLLNLSGTIIWDANTPVSPITDLYTLIQQFGTIKYKINEQEYTSTIEMKEVKPIKTTLKNTCYIEVPSEIMYATNIYVELNIRNKTYIYNLK